MELASAIPVAVDGPTPRYGTNVSEGSESVRGVTANNRMEIQAAIEGLTALQEPCRVTLITDSVYLINAITTWRHARRGGDWVIRTKSDKPMPNRDLWQILDELVEARRTDRARPHRRRIIYVKNRATTINT